MLRLFRADLWTPLVEVMFPTIDEVRHDHTGYREDKNAHENFICLERRSGNGDHKADTRSRGIQLANHDTAAPVGHAKAACFGRDRRALVLHSVGA